MYFGNSISQLVRPLKDDANGYRVTLSKAELVELIAELDKRGHDMASLKIKSDSLVKNDKNNKPYIMSNISTYKYTSQAQSASK